MVDAAYIEALEIVERDLYSQHPCVLASDDLPQLRGHARRLVAVVVTWWAAELGLRRTRVIDALGPETLGALREFAPDERERAVHALFERLVLGPAGPIVPWAGMARLFGALLDDDRRTALDAVESVAPGLVGRLQARLRGATRAEREGSAEAGDATLAAGAAVVLGARRSEVVPDVAATLRERLEAEAVAGMLAPGWTRTRDARDVPTAPEVIDAEPAGEGDLLAVLDREREDRQIVERLRAAGLTPAELELATLLAQGDAESLAEAARLLGRAESTARNQARAIRRKLDPRKIRQE